MSAHPFRIAADPRHLQACATCGMPAGHPRHGNPVEGDGLRPRNVRLERELMDVACRAAGRIGHDPFGRPVGDDAGLSALADLRAHPGGVRAHLEATREIAEELADARNYAVWGIERVWDAYLVGDHDATRDYDRLMRFLTRLVDAWHELHTLSA